MATSNARTTRSADGVSIGYEVRGTGSPTLIFVHGWSCDRSFWNEQLEHFAARYRVVGVDLAGHGASALGRTEYTMPAFGDDVVAVANDLGLESIVLIGHSMGGDVILPAARRLGARVAGLVWVDTYRSLTAARTPEEHEALVAPIRADFLSGVSATIRPMFRPECDPALVERVIERMAATPPEVGISAVHYATSYEPEVVAILPSLRVPFVAINPDYRPTDFDSLRRHGIEVVVMPNSSHFLMMEDPATFNRLLAETLERLVAEQHRRD